MSASDGQPTGCAHTHAVEPDRAAAARARVFNYADAKRLASLVGLLADPMRAASNSPS
jgi:hypothetical protein